MNSELTKEKTKYLFLITDDKFSTPEKDQNILVEKYYDLEKKYVLTFIKKEKDLFIIFSQNAFGSAFFGNTVILSPKYYMIKKINPLLILIPIIFKFSSKTEFKDINVITKEYEEALQKNKINDQLIKSSKQFLQTIFNENVSQLETISETKEISDGNDKTYCVKLCESKITNFINSKVNLNTEECVSIELEETSNDDKEILKKRKLFEKASIFEPFLPNEFFMDYLKYKQIDEFVKKKNENYGENMNNETIKRKINGKNDKTAKKRGKKEPAVVSKNQGSIFSFLNKTSA